MYWSSNTSVVMRINNLLVTCPCRLYLCAPNLPLDLFASFKCKGIFSAPSHNFDTVIIINGFLPIQMK